MKAEIYPRQEERLARLREYEILDTPREADFDDIADLAGRICETPIALISFVDRDRQWFKSETGLGVCETSLDESICSHALLGEEFLEIPDTHADERTRDNPLCMGEDPVRFYAGALLVTENGLPLGSLCVLDRRPRTLSDLQRHTLRVLARQVMQQMNLRLALSRTDLLRKEIDHRVKNSLQAIAAYVRLHRSGTEGGEAQNILTAVLSRIEAVAAMHEELYRADVAGRINLRNLGARMEYPANETCPPGIGVRMELDDVDVDAGQASALTVVLNEFVANSIKHAFTDRIGGGSIRIRGESRNSTLDVICSDDGSGLPEKGAQPAGSGGLGTRIIEASVTQLGGAADWSSEAGGTELRFSFRL